MPEDGNDSEFDLQSHSDRVSKPAQRIGAESDISQKITAWRSTETEWKDLYDESLPAGTYEIHTQDTDIDTVQKTVERLLDGQSEYYIWDTREVYSSAKARRRDEPALKHVLVRTTAPIPIDQLPDTPRITSY